MSTLKQHLFTASKPTPQFPSCVAVSPFLLAQSSAPLPAASLRDVPCQRWCRAAGGRCLWALGPSNGPQYGHIRQYAESMVGACPQFTQKCACAMLLQLMLISSSSAGAYLFCAEWTTERLCAITWQCLLLRGIRSGDWSVKRYRRPVIFTQPSFQSALCEALRDLPPPSLQLRVFI